MQYRYYNRIFGDLDAINRVVKHILLDTERLMDEDIHFDFRLILNELLINGFEHGNKKNLEKSILLKLKIDDTCIHILVQDEGKGLKVRQKYRAEECKPDGRGLLLVESLADQFDYDKNKIRCKINLAPES